MDVLHVVLEMSGTTIPVEIGSALADLDGVTARVVSERPLPDTLPDTIDEAQVLTEHCDFGDYRDLLSAVADEFDVVHTHHVGPAARIGFHAVSHPIVHFNTQHGHLHYTRNEKIKNVPGLLLADSIVYNSRATANSYNTLERLCKACADERVVHNGINMAALEPYRASVDEPTTVVTATRLIPRKNLETLIRAFQQLDGLSLTIVGDGPHRNELRRTARDAGVESQVVFEGYLPDREGVYEVLAAADVFALPSHGEGFCVAVAEAMAVGLPVVVSDIGVFHEVVGEDGVYVDRTSHAAIAAALDDLRQDPDRAALLGDRNRERARNQFTLERCARGYRDAYRDVLAH